MLKMSSQILEYLFCLTLAIVLLLHEGVTGIDRELSTSVKDDRGHQKNVLIGSSRKFTGLYTGPYFDPDTPTNVTATLGDTALLPCLVKQLGDQTVSWIRKRDVHILTVDFDTFISDDRFFVFQRAMKNTGWTLGIRYVTHRDSGLYECQISTDPSMSHFIHLKVLETQVTIVDNGDGDIHANSGSKVVFKCRISQTLTKPDFIFWYHNDVRLMIDKDPNMLASIRSISDDEWEATLALKKVDKNLSGNYTCSPSNTIASTVRLHILNGETRAAISDGRSRSSTTHFLRANILSILIISIEFALQ